MNNGANNIYLGTTQLFRTPGDKPVTNDANRTELARTYCIIKTHEADALAILIPGYQAEGYSNLFLFNPPARRVTETHVYFDCIFQGTLSPEEGGRDPAYETLDVQSNIEPYLPDYSSELVYFVSPVNRYMYSVPAGQADRSITRVIPIPEKVMVRNNIAASYPSGTTIISIGGSLIALPANYEAPGSRFFWSATDVDRRNFGAVDEIIESWTLKSKEVVLGD